METYIILALFLLKTPSGCYTLCSNSDTHHVQILQVYVMCCLLSPTTTRPVYICTLNGPPKT